MQEFYINRNSTLPVLRMELINDGRYDFHKAMLYNNAIQDSVIKFNMWNERTGILHISNKQRRTNEGDSC